MPRLVLACALASSAVVGVLAQPAERVPRIGLAGDDLDACLSVVYGSDPAAGPGDCGVGAPAASVRPYSGSCRWGWVHSRYVTMIAG